MSNEREILELIRTLGSEHDHEAQKHALDALVKISEPAVMPLVKALQSKDWSVRERAAVALGKVRDARATDALIQAINDEDPRVQWAAAYALGELRDARAVEPLIDALQYCVIPLEIVTALGKIADARAVEPLITVLKDVNSNVREGAAIALGRIGDARAIEPLEQALTDDNAFVRETATLALKIMKGKK